METTDDVASQRGLTSSPDGKVARERSCDLPFSITAEEGTIMSFSTSVSAVVSLVPVTTRQLEEILPMRAVIVVFPGSLGRIRRADFYTG